MFTLPDGDRLVLSPPSLELLAGYEAALVAGWSPNATRDVCAEQLAALRENRGRFLNDLRHQDWVITGPDGQTVTTLASRLFWISDGGFCGSINLRFAVGTEELPPHASGHVGYAVIPSKRRRGYATRALTLLLPMARDEGLSRILVTCDEDNTGSLKVIAANGGVLAGSEAHPAIAGKRKLAFWVNTSGSW